MKKNWLKIQDIFNDVLELPQKEWSKFIKQASMGSQQIEDEVWNLLEDFEQANSYFEDFELELSKTLGEFTDPIPQIDNYEIQGILGEGGMAKVYLAERNDGKLEQTLAIKVMKMGLDRKSIERFEYEKKILSSLQHPRLAQIFDAGLTDYGQQYFIMEYVQGQSITDYCKQNSLTIEDRLSLFDQICDVVQYAHQNLLIHRDIKPSNILVTANGEAKLLDFGVAKFLNDQDPELTQTGQMMLTPNYVSPEQLLDKPVDTRSDIYQLGLLLHELLTTARPRLLNQKQTLLNQDITSLEAQPLTKSFDRLDPKIQSEVARECKSNIYAIKQLFKTDLANIPLKCLELSPENRYESVGQLKEDLRRYVLGLPLIAKKQSNTYLLSKFVQRNKVVVLFSIALFLSLVGGIVLTSWQAQIAYQNQQKAEKQGQRAKRISEFLIKLFSSPDPRNPLGENKDITLRAFLSERSNYLENELKEDPELQLELSGILGDLYHNMSYYKASKELEKKLLPKYIAQFGSRSPQYLRSKLRIIAATQNLGGTSEADSMYQQLLIEFENKEDLNFARILNAYALFLQTVKGDFVKTDSILSRSENIFIRERDTINTDFSELLSSKGLLKNVLGQLAEAQNYYERELYLRKQLTTEDPVAIALAESNLSTVLQKQGILEQAKELQLKSLKILQEILGEDHIHSIHALNNLAIIYNRMYDYEKAERVAEQVLSLYLKKLGNSSHETAIAYLNTVFYMVKKEKYEEALDRTQKAKDILNTILPPSHYVHVVPLFADALIYNQTNKAGLSLEQSAKAERILASSIPPNHEYWGILHSRQAEAYLKLKQLSKAEELALKSYNILNQSLGDKHLHTQYTIKTLVEVFRLLGKHEQQASYQERLIE
ncbi:MAG: serine/threonine-protein kinase [Saprospiraceae bacterium]|nr:serine/threonine-protein kinase [Saprospiraceae bacterium]